MSRGRDMVRQAEFPLGVIGVIAGGAACGGCGFTMPSDATICPACGFERVAYPAGAVARYDWALNQPIGDPLAKLVLLALVAHDKPNSEGIFPSQARLARLTGLSRRSVVNALKRLRKAGWVEREKLRRRDGRHCTNRYVIRQPGLARDHHVHEVHLDHVHEVHTKG